MKIHDVALQHGNKAAARAVINKQLFNSFHMKIEDFADIPDLQGWLDQMEVYIGQGINQGKMPKEKILALCKRIIVNSAVQQRANVNS